LSRCAPENKSGPRIVTGKMAIEELKNNKTQNNTWTNPQIKDHKKSHELRLTRPQTPHMKPEHTYLKFLTASMEKIVNLYGFT
jgi:hypothetical protein